MEWLFRLEDGIIIVMHLSIRYFFSSCLSAKLLVETLNVGLPTRRPDYVIHHQRVSRKPWRYSRTPTCEAAGAYLEDVVSDARDEVRLSEYQKKNPIFETTISSRWLPPCPFGMVRLAVGCSCPAPLLAQSHGAH